MIVNIRRYKFLFVTVLVLLSYKTFPQKFDTHKVIFLQKQGTKDVFDREEFRRKLVEKYKGTIKWKVQFDNFINSSVEDAESLYNSNIIYSNWTDCSAYLEKIVEKTLPEYYNKKPMKVCIIKDPEINAFVLSDDRIFINVGLLANAKSEAELAEVLGHEYGHFFNNHYLTYYINAVKTRMIVNSSGSLLGPLFDVFVMKNFSNDLVNCEKEADSFSINLFSNNGYCAKDAIGINQTFIKLEKKRKADKFNKIPLFYFRTHPLTENRLKDAEKQSENFTTTWCNKTLVDSVMFETIKSQAIDECLLLMLRNGNFSECIEFAFKQHLFYPNDEFYQFIIIEALRRQIIVRPGFAKELFITGNYFLDTPDLPESKTSPKHINTKAPYVKDYVFKNSIFTHLKGLIYGMDSSDLKKIKNLKLRNLDTLEFVYNSEALEYFLKLSRQSGINKYSLKLSDSSKTNTDFEIGKSALAQEFNSHCAAMDSMNFLAKKFNNCAVITTGLEIYEDVKSFSQSNFVPVNSNIRFYNDYLSYFQRESLSNIKIEPSLNVFEKDLISDIMKNLALFSFKQVNQSKKFVIEEKEFELNVDLFKLVPELNNFFLKNNYKKIFLQQISKIPESSFVPLDYTIFCIDFQFKKVRKFSYRHEAGDEKRAFKDILEYYSKLSQN